MEKEKVKEKKKLSIKEIGPARLVILLMAGIFLLVLSFPDMLSSENSSKDNTAKQDYKVKENTDNTETDDETEAYINELENRLKKVLAKVEGIGDVDVMITLKGSKEKVILKDGPYTQESMNEVDGEGGNRDSSSISKEDTTVLVNGGNGEGVPYVIQEKEPEVEGVVVIAEGGGNAKIMTEIMEAAQVLFDVPAHKVKVMKMNK
ncbi:stage III sporulation protein AG [Anaerocolumna sedimenticola]|uniref:Stage III sporulation protein AG n=1 Tax=Anaerocolumna sedimenticola TaxID=2696063 RepID=A0A6P1TP60_9FIRM|nr:stage III sporulation protein AG [Anaerocolumna sedimenticola]QHQ62774.1 stage III sporulation protein AG [Anaerocolumna sedimenticola]